MEKRLSRFIAKSLIGCCPGISFQENIIVFGLELIISGLIGILIMAGISIWQDVPFAWLSFLLGFAPLRTTAGGYHAPTHGLCYIVSTTIFTACLLYVKYLSISDFQLFSYSLISFLIVVLFSPVAANNKPLSTKNRKKNRDRSLWITSISFFISIVFCINQALDVHSILFIFGNFSASISLIFAKAINHFRKEDNSEITC